MDIVGLSEVRRHCSGETSSWCYAFYWFGREDGAHLWGVGVGISSQLQRSVIGVTLVDVRIMLVRLKHTLDFISLIAVYAPTERSELEEEMF